MIQAVENEPFVTQLENIGVRRYQIGQAAGRNRSCLRTQLASKLTDEVLYLPDESVDDARLKRRWCVDPDCGRRLNKGHAHQFSSLADECINCDFDARRDSSAQVFALR